MGRNAPLPTLFKMTSDINYEEPYFFNWTVNLCYANTKALAGGWLY